MTEATTGGATAQLEGVVPPGGMSLPPQMMEEMNRLVRGLAGRLHARLPQGCGIEISDLVQAGNVGLLKAARTFAADVGTPLAGYAKFRIRGEMLDMVRRNAGRERLPIGAPPNSTGGSEVESVCQASNETSPQFSALNEQRVSIIAEELRRLPLRYLSVVRLRYANGLTLKQIGAALNVNESRACQIHQVALDRLKRALWSRGVRDFAHL